MTDLVVGRSEGVAYSNNNLTYNQFKPAKSYKDKVSFMSFFRTKRVIEMADLIVTKIESSELYYVHKYRYADEQGNSYTKGDIISKNEFNNILLQAKRPIVLSDIYIDLGLE